MHRTGDRVLVTGAGGFIGHHLVTFLRRQGSWVRGVDLKHPEFASSDANEFELLACGAGKIASAPAWEYKDSSANWVPDD